MPKYILGIESSCDESCASVVADGRVLISQQVASSALIHRAYGGVVPEIASREHLLSTLPVVKEALAEAKLSLKDLTAIAVTDRPGLLGSLIVGVSVAKALSFASGLPLVPVHHLASHIAANYLVHKDLTPPYLALVVSGAHSHVVYVKDYTDFKILAQTRDDAPGEAYDKVGRKMGLPYPGGPLVDKLAQSGEERGIALPKSRFEGSLDFSFSGLKTAVINLLYKAEQEAKKKGLAREAVLANKDLAYAFQKAVSEVLVSHTETLLEQTGAKALVLAGGVAANSGLRQAAEVLCEKRGIPLYAPPLPLCTDNAAMVAAQGFYAFEAGIRGGLDLNPVAVSSLEVL